MPRDQYDRQRTVLQAKLCRAMKQAIRFLGRRRTAQSRRRYGYWLFTAEAINRRLIKLDHA